MQPTLSTWLQRGQKAPKKRKRINSVSKKRSEALRIYAKKRRAFLAKRRLCQAYDRIVFWAGKNAMRSSLALDTWYEVPFDRTPLATEIHHTKKPRSKYLNDESTWLAVCRWSHNWIENNKSTARQVGLLQ